MSGGVLRMTAEQYQARAAKKSGNKFGAKKKVVDGIGFDSTHEADRYMALQLEAKAGEIRALKLQVPMQVQVRLTAGPTAQSERHVFTYVCDFVYERKELKGYGDDWTWRTVHEDAKGYRKGSAYQLFRLKKAVIKAALGIEVEEV